MKTISIVLTGLLLLFTIFFICRRLLALAAVVCDAHSRFCLQQREAIASGQQNRRYMPLSVLLMAGSDPQALLTTLDSLKNQTYPLVEILILEDSMDDAVLQSLVTELELLPMPQPVRRQLNCTSENAIYENCAAKIRLIRKPKTSLGDAWNLGINIARYPYFACIPSGAKLPQNALDNLMAPFFQYEDTVAAGGSLHHEGISLNMPLSVLENLEFDRSVPALQTLLRSRTLLLFDGPTAYRKDAVIEAGGFPSWDDSLDIGLTLSLQRFSRKRKRPCRIVYIPEGLGYLPPDASLSTLLLRRRRWQQGAKKAMHSGRALLLPQFGAAGIQYFLFLVFSIWAPLLAVLGAATILLCLAMGLIDSGLLLEILLLSLLFKLLLSITAFQSRTPDFSLSPFPVFLPLWLTGSSLYRLCVTLARIWGLFS